MIGALVYFLIDLRAAVSPQGVFYMRWLLFWFLLAAVALNRMRAKRKAYGSSWALLSVALAAVTLLFLTATSRSTRAFTGQYVSQSLAFLMNLVIVGVIWFGTDRVTADCSLDGWSEDSVAEGLFTEDKPEERIPRKRKVKRPGLLIILLALPAAVLFGLSQYLLPGATAQVRRDAWISAAAYIFFSLTLLTITSARLQQRYLAKRRVEVSANGMASWLLVGIAIAVFALAAARVFPKPNLVGMLRGERYTQVPGEGRSLPFLPRGGTRQPRPGEGEGESAFSRLAERVAAIFDRTSDSAKGEKPEDESKEGQAQGGKEQKETGEGKEGKGGQPQRTPVTPPGGRLAQGVTEIATKILAVLIILALLIAVLVFLFPRFAKIIRKLRPKKSWLRNLLARLRRKPRAPRPVSVKPMRFVNPFRSSRLLKKMSPKEIARYTYQALLAYADYRGCARLPQETPYEYARRLSDSGAQIAPLASSATKTYIVAAYAPQELPDSSLDELRRIWSGLEAYAP